MLRLTWVLYFIGAALVLGSWLGFVGPILGWIGWGLATGIAVASWAGWLPGSGKIRGLSKAARARKERESRAKTSWFSTEELEAARREVSGR